MWFCFPFGFGAPQQPKEETNPSFPRCFGNFWGEVWQKKSQETYKKKPFQSSFLVYLHFFLFLNRSSAFFASSLSCSCSFPPSLLSLESSKLNQSQEKTKEREETREHTTKVQDKQRKITKEENQNNTKMRERQKKAKQNKTHVDHKLKNIDHKMDEAPILQNRGACRSYTQKCTS